VPALLSALADDDAVVRHVAVAALQRIGAWPETAAGLKSDQARIRDGTLFALREAYDLDVRRGADSPYREVSGCRGGADAGGAAAEAGALDGRWWRNGPEAYAEDDPKVAPRIEHPVDWAGTDRVLAVLRTLPTTRPREPP